MKKAIFDPTFWQCSNMANNMNTDAQKLMFDLSTKRNKLIGQLFGVNKAVRYR